MPIPVFSISITASLALRMSGNRAVATVVGTTGARRMVTSVTMPSVPSAPMNSFVVSNPADDLRERRLVLITSPDGRTTVYTKAQHSRSTDGTGTRKADCVQKPFALRCTIPHRVGYRETVQYKARGLCHGVADFQSSQC